MQTYEIWIGKYNLGQGYDGSKEPQMIGKVLAKDFKTACFKHELMSRLEAIENQEKKSSYISDQDYEWFYNPKTNSCAWLGKYFETKEEAQKTFSK